MAEASKRAASLRSNRMASMSAIKSRNGRRGRVCVCVCVCVWGGGMCSIYVNKTEDNASKEIETDRQRERREVCEGNVY